MMNREDKIRHYFETLHASGFDLTDWEKSFLSSTARQFNSKGDLSDRQLEILERIYSEKTPTGSHYGESVESKESRRYEGFSEKDDNAPGRSTMRRGWRERGYDD